jgi:aspartate 1-decarboxylase
MIRRFVRAVIHNATVTHADSAWPVSIRIDDILLRAAELLPFEEVELVNIATGERFTTWVEPAPEGSGMIRVHSGEAHHVRAGDVISVTSFGLLHDGQTLSHRARVLTLDAGNHIVSLDER